jgi:hypothetical protein
VQVSGIRGAAAAHVVTFCCLALVYVFWGIRTIGIPPGGIVGQLRGIGACVVVQALVTAAVALGIRSAGFSSLVAGLVGAGSGALALALMLRTRARPLLDEGRAVISAAVRRETA